MIFSMNKSLTIHSILKEKNQEKHFFFLFMQIFWQKYSSYLHLYEVFPIS